MVVGSVGGPVFAADAAVGPFSVFLGQGFTYDSNVFRLGPAANAQQVIGDSNRSDWISTTRGGAVFETQQSLQRFRLSGEVNYSKYNRFSQLDHTGRNLAALWDWKVGNRWFGEARAAQINNLTPFQDYRVLSANTQTSRTTVNDYFLSGNYWALPDWSLGAGVGRNSGRYSADVLKPAEYDANFGELAARYRPPTGSEVVLRYRHTRGEFPNRTNPIDSKAYTQDEVSVSSSWPITAASRVEGSLGVTRRQLDDYVDPAQKSSNANFTGVTGRLLYDWKITAATSLNVGLTRATLPVQNTDADYSVVTALGISPTWAVTSKVRVQARFEEAWRDLKGGVSNGQADQLETLGLNLIYLPIERLETNLSLSTQRRTADNANLEFRTNVFFIGGRYTFY